jgi:hypothetical protein
MNSPSTVQTLRTVVVTVKTVYYERHELLNGKDLSSPLVMAAILLRNGKYFDSMLLGKQDLNGKLLLLFIN